MADNKLKFYGEFDSSKIEQHTKKLQQNLKNSFGNGIEVISPESRDFLKNTASQSLIKLKKETKDLEQEFRNITEQMKAQEVSAEKKQKLAQYQVFVSNKLLENAKKTRALEVVDKRLSPEQRRGLMRSRVIDAEYSVNKPRRGVGFFGRVGSTLAPMGSALPGFGNVAAGAMGRGVGAAAGMGAVGGLALGAVGAAAGLAAAGMMKLAGAAKRYEAAVPQLLKINALGQTEYRGVGKQTARQMGFGPEETYKLQESIAKAFGPRNQRQAEAMGGNLMTFGRQFGMDPTQLAGMGNRLRQVGGTESSQKTMALMMAKATSSEINKSQIGHYMEATANLLAEINEGGHLDASSMIGVLANMIKAGSSPEQVAKQISDINQGIVGSSGESRTFLTEAFLRGGVGGDTLMQAQTAVDTGLFGVDMKKLTEGMSDQRRSQVSAEFSDLSGPGATRKKAGGILDLLNERTAGLGAMSRGAELSRMLGVKGGAVGGIKAETILRKMLDSSDASVEKQREMLKSLTEDPEKQWRNKVQDTLSSIDQTLRVASTKTALDQATMGQGKGTIGYVQKLDGLMVQLSGATLKVIKAFDRLSQEYLPPFTKAIGTVAETLGIGPEEADTSAEGFASRMAGSSKVARTQDKFRMASKGGTLAPEAWNEFIELQAQNRKGQRLDPALIKQFKEDQAAGGGTDLTTEALVSILNVLKNIRDEGKNRKFIEANYKTPPDPFGAFK